MPSFGCLGGDYGGEHGGLAIGGDDGAVGLTRDLFRFPALTAATPVKLHIDEY